MRHHMANVKFARVFKGSSALGLRCSCALDYSLCTPETLRKVALETFARVITEGENCTDLYRLCIVRNGGHIEHVP